MSACFFSSCVCVSFIYLFFGIPRPLVHARTSASGIEGLLMWSMSLNSASLSLDFFSLFFFFLHRCLLLPSFFSSNPRAVVIPLGVPALDLFVSCVCGRRVAFLVARSFAFDQRVAGL